MIAPFTALRDHFIKLLPAIEPQLSDILPWFESYHACKDELLIEENHPSDHLYFVAAGMLNLFFKNNQGHPQTIHFAMENWWIADYPSLTSLGAAAFSVQALEDSALVRIKRNRYNELLITYPMTAVYFNQVHQRAYAAALMKQKIFATVSKEEFHRYFFTTYPDFVSRVPAHILASYFGISVDQLRDLTDRMLS